MSRTLRTWPCPVLDGGSLQKGWPWCQCGADKEGQQMRPLTGQLCFLQQETAQRLPLEDMFLHLLVT